MGVPAASCWLLTLLCALFGAAHSGPSSREDYLGCPAPRSPENGLSFIFNNGRLVRYRCHPGFKLRGHSEAVCHQNRWNRPTPLCLARNGTRRGTTASHHSGHQHGHNHAGRNHFEWDSMYKEEKLPLINGEWRKPHHRGSHVFSLAGSSKELPARTASEQQLIDDEVKIAEMRHRQEHEVRRTNHDESDEENALRSGVAPAREANEVATPASGSGGAARHGHSHHSVATSHSADADSLPHLKKYYKWKEDSPRHHSTRYSTSRLASGRTSSEESVAARDRDDDRDGSNDEAIETSTESPSSHASLESAPREAWRKQSDIPDYWKSLSGGYSSERRGHHRQHAGTHNADAEETTTHKTISRAFKRSYLHSDDDYDLEDDDADDDEDDEPSPDAQDTTRYRQTTRGDLSPYDDSQEERPRQHPRTTVTFERGQEPAKGPKGDREPDDRPSGSSGDRRRPQSSPVDYFGRPVQVLSGEKAHQQDALLRRQYEQAQQRRRAGSFEEARGPPPATVRFDPPPSSGPVTSRPRDYFGRPVQVHTGEKAAQAEALLKRQYEMVQQRMRDNERDLEEVRKRPDDEYFPRQGVSDDDRRGDIPVRARGDRDPLPTPYPPRYQVTSRPVDYFGRPVQVLTGDKAAQAEAMLRRQYEEYQARLNRRPGEPDFAEGRPVEFDRRPVQPGPSTSPPFDHFGRPVQVLTGEKAGQQTALLRQQYESAQRSGLLLQEARSRPAETVHRHRHHHGHATDGTSGSLRLSREDLELMSRLSPELRADFVRDLRQARVKEETDPERAKQFLSRYRDAYRTKSASQHTKSLSTESQEDDAATGSSGDEDDDDYDDGDLQGDQPPEDIPLTTASTEDTSSELAERKNSSKHSSSKATYDQSCLQDRRLGRSFLSAPKVRHAYVYKYERKVLNKPAETHYVLARYKCLLGYRLKYAKTDALYCRQRQWIGEHPHCVREES